MKIPKVPFLPLFFVGMFITAAFGSAINNLIARSDSWVSHLLLAGYTVGLIAICASFFHSLSSRIDHLESQIEKLGETRS